MGWREFMGAEQDPGSPHKSSFRQICLCPVPEPVTQGKHRPLDPMSAQGRPTEAEDLSPEPSRLTVVICRNGRAPCLPHRAGVRVEGLARGQGLGKLLNSHLM